MVGILGAIAMISAAVVVPIQQASAQSNTFNFDLNFDQRQSNRCSGFAGCTNIGSDNPDSP
jgi:hypothetical protein